MKRSCQCHERNKVYEVRDWVIIRRGIDRFNRAVVKCLVCDKQWTTKGGYTHRVRNATLDEGGEYGTERCTECNVAEVEYRGVPGTTREGKTGYCTECWEMLTRRLLRCEYRNKPTYTYTKDSSGRPGRRDWNEEGADD